MCCYVATSCYIDISRHTVMLELINGDPIHIHISILDSLASRPAVAHFNFNGPRELELELVITYWRT